MLKRHPSYSQLEDNVDGLTEWIWHSHSWVEYRPGYYECQWCKKRHTSEMPIYKSDSLCIKNPAVTALLKICGVKMGEENG